MKTKNLLPYQLIGFTASNPESWFVVISSDLQSGGVIFFAHVSKLRLDFQLETDASMDRQFKEKAAQLIAIEDIPALSKLTFKHTAQQSGDKSARYCNKVDGSLKNLSGRKLRGVDVQNILITCKKDAWIKATNDNQLKLGHFVKDSCLGEVS